MRTDPEAILEFWFDEAGPARWFKRSDTFDALIRERFLSVWKAAASGECGALRLFTALGNGKALEHEIRHRDVLRTYGRYPGRNAALDRDCTPGEQEYLKAGGGF